MSRFRLEMSYLHVALGCSVVACSSDEIGARGAPTTSSSAGAAAGCSHGGGTNGRDANASESSGGGGSAALPDAASEASLSDDVALGPPPDFGPNVLVFDASMPMATIQSQIDAVRDKQRGYPAHEFADTRYAYFFKPGQYRLDVWVEYYMQVLGLGALPDDVTITGAVRSKPDNGTIALVNFWRAVENLAVIPTEDDNVEVWAVSQGTSLRRAHVKGAIHLSDQNGWSSGGFIADTKIDDVIDSGTQQQFFTRNTDLSTWRDGNFNHYALAFVGDVGAPAMNWPRVSYSVVDKTPVIREKPYLYIDKDGNYFVRVPVLKTDSQGPSWSGSTIPAGRSITTGRFHVAKPGVDSAATLNAALAQGKHLLFTPGIYHLGGSIDIENPNTVVMGLGLATLIADQGTPIFKVADVDGVTIASLLLQAGPNNSDTLLEVGPSGSSAAHAENPTAIYDLSCRVGGAAAGRATSCVTINSGDVLGDNLWMWRADHGSGVGWNVNTSKHGLVVNGKNVTVYGLLVEHFQDYQTLWNADGGRLYFYQSEMPYDPPNQAAWQRGAVKGYPSYNVADAVTSHQALGFGVYSAFQTQVSAENAIEAPDRAGIVMRHMATATFSGTAGVQIAHIFNGTGDYVGPGHTPSFSAK